MDIGCLKMQEHLGTPRQVEAQELCGDQYLYFVLKSGILEICSQYPD